VAQKKTPYRNAKPPAPEKGRRNWLWIGVAMATLAVASVVLYFAYTGSRPGSFDFARNRPLGKTGVPVTAQYVGSDACASCHNQETAGWRKSQHHDAMARASEQSVLGNFNNAKFAYAGLTSTFFKRGGEFFVNTEGRDGKLTDYEVKYTFGVSPLQQYLIEFPDGRLQALSIAWNTRPKNEGGQRWFHLYPNDRITHKDELHWTGPAQVELHVRRLPLHRRAQITIPPPINSKHAGPIDVGCEACHGPARGT
jgi:hypothetical protein